MNFVIAAPTFLVDEENSIQASMLALEVFYGRNDKAIFSAPDHERLYRELFAGNLDI